MDKVPRKRVVGRRLRVTRAIVNVCNPLNPKAEITQENVTISLYKSGDELLRRIRKKIETPEKRVVNVVSYKHNIVKYTMSEDTYLKYADVEEIEEADVPDASKE